MRHLATSTLDSTCWVLVLGALGWRLFKSFADSDDRMGFVKRWVITALLVLFAIDLLRRGSLLLMIAPMVAAAFIWIPSLAEILIKPVTSAFDGGHEESESKPYYFTAEGKRRKGRYAEAMADIRQQLELFPGDYEGCMKLASIQMDDLKDFPAALATLNEFLQMPGHPANEVVAVLHLLADWQLQRGKGADAARHTLQHIVDAYPNTPFAHAALQRIAHLEQADEAVRFRSEARFTVTPIGRDAGLRKGAIQPAPAEASPRQRVDDYVRQLQKHPYDTEAREQLATLYAEEFNRIDLAADQLEQLIALPTEPPKRIAHWLNLLATIQVKCARDIDAGEKALRRVSGRFPGTALASRAVERLATLNGELKGVARMEPKAMGVYERNLGLKR